MRLLIVEDEVRLADTLRQLLNRQGYTADVCYDGVSGLDNAMTGIYDLMVLDVMLPGMNGFQVVKKLREAGVATPVLMLTAKSDVGDRIHGLDCGAAADNCRRATRSPGAICRWNAPPSPSPARSVRYGSAAGSTT